MKSLFLSLLVTSLALLLPQDAQAGSKRDRSPRQWAPAGASLLSILDTDKDGALSAQEIERAAAALKTLDKNNDGTVSPEELGVRSGGGRGKRGEQASEDRKKHREDDDDDEHEEDDDDSEKEEKTTTSSKSGSSAQVSQWMSFDKNGDGKLTADELPQRMAGIITQADADKDNAVTPQELEAHVAAQAAKPAATEKQ